MSLNCWEITIYTLLVTNIITYFSKCYCVLKTRKQTTNTSTVQNPNQTNPKPACSLSEMIVTDMTQESFQISLLFWSCQHCVKPEYFTLLLYYHCQKSRIGKTFNSYYVTKVCFHTQYMWIQWLWVSISQTVLNCFSNCELTDAEV